jgi:GDP-4-dehydro-6-deoxy-D-mannose reductase
MKKIFFTGANGFIGTNLSSYLREQDKDIEIHEYSGKIESFEELKTAFQKEKWDYIFHFAGMSHVADCEADPQKAYEVNVLGTLFLAQLISESNFSGKLFFTSTALVYDVKPSMEKVEINESFPISPKNTYSRTKYFSENILKTLAESSSCSVFVLRLFNHTHKTQSVKFFLPSVYRQISESENGGTIKVGNIDLVRDFSLITDFTKKFWNLMNEKANNRFQIVNLSSGIPRRLRDIVEIMIKKSGKHLQIVVDPMLVRKNDPGYVVGKFSTSYQSTVSDEQFVVEFISL